MESEDSVLKSAIIGCGWVADHPFLPNKFVDVSEYMKAKEKALYTYSDEMRATPHSRSVENIVRLNQCRGHGVGYQYAEAFSVIRVLV